MKRFLLAGLCVAAAAQASPVAAGGGIKLKAIRFPANLTGTGGTKTPPTAAPLSQRVVFEFTGKPKIGVGIAEGLKIRVASGAQSGLPAFGTYEVVGHKVVFTPRLPTSSYLDFTANADVGGDTSLPGLLPGTTYRIEVTIGETNSVKNLTGIKKGVALPIEFTTTDQTSDFFANAPDKPVKVKKGKITPKPGTKNLYPNPFADPAGLFTDIPKQKRPPFVLLFDGPVSPLPVNFTRNFIRLVAVETPDGAPEDVILGTTPVLVRNEPDGARILLYPNGLLPLGHTVELRISNKFLALSGAQAGAGKPEEFETVGVYRVAKDPLPGTPVDDFLEENFDTPDRMDPTVAQEGLQLAGWDAGNSNVLRASFGFGGDGSLGRFEPPVGKDLTIFLDTDFQTFPLFSGATPEAPPGTVVAGGVFHFTDFHLPPNATLVARGSNPLIITATGNVLIEGRIDLNGQNGSSDDTFDSAITPMPGGSAGPGGGQGGDSHPVKLPTGGQNIAFMQNPQFGETGHGPFDKPGGGGGGGQCGATMPWSSFGGCNNFAGAGDGSRGSGGGGGSFTAFLPQPSAGPVTEDPSVPVSGRRGAIGWGNHLPVEFDPSAPIPPEPDCYQAQPGNPTNAIAKVNPNPTMKEAIENGWVYDKGTPFNKNHPSATKHRVTLFGAAGPMVFQDSDPDNDYIGPGGEVPSIIGGQGGGGAGSRSEGMDRQCGLFMFSIGLPFTTLDARGGGGGGAGGALLVQALGTIEIKGQDAKIEARGGNGGGGEGTESSSRGGAGGGGSGGAVILQSATNVIMNESLADVVIDVSGGCGANGPNLSGSSSNGLPPGGDTGVLQFGDGGPGGPGIVQIHVPPGVTPQVDTSKIVAYVSLDVLNISSGSSLPCNTGEPPFTGQSPINPLVDMQKTPTPFTSVSVARSTWYDLGAVTSAFRPPVATPAGPIAGPIFGIPGLGPFFKGTDPLTGEVLTDAEGHVLDPFANDIEVDAPDLGKPDYIPRGVLEPYAQSVRVFFQGADESQQFPGTPDLQTATDWVSDPTLLNGKRFVRWEVRFDIATDPDNPPTPFTPRPQVNRLRVPFKY